MSIHEQFTLNVKQLHPAAQLPLRGSTWAAGADLHCVADFTLQPGARLAVPTGLALEIPPGFYGRVAPRSGWAAKHGIDTLAGIIDADYRGELLVLLVNLGLKPFTAQAGERIAQIIIERAALCSYTWVAELAETERGAGGFGSTGR
jgi:deoxyuridine 5'-triphosphate nucleotidohydrolase